MAFGIDDIAMMAGPQIIGSLIQADAAKDAAGMQADATNRGIGEQGRQFDIARSDTAPYRSAGNSGLFSIQQGLGLGGNAEIPQDRFDVQGYLSQNPDVAADPYYGSHPYEHYLQHGKAEIFNGRRQLGFDPNGNQPTAPGTSPGELTRKFSLSDFWNDPVTQASYQSGLDLGKTALRNAAPLTTGLDSGAALKELTKFGTDYTGQKAGESYNRFTNDQGNTFNKLSTLTGLGQTAVGQVNNAGMNSANNISGMLTSQGNANAASRIAGANAFGGALGSISNWWQQNQMLNRVLGGRVPGGAGNGGVPTGGWDVSNDWRM